MEAPKNALGIWLKAGIYEARERVNKLVFLPGLIFLLVPIVVTSIEIWSYVDGIEMYNEGLGYYPTFNYWMVIIFWIIGLFPFTFSMVFWGRGIRIYKHFASCSYPILYNAQELAIDIFCNYKWKRIKLSNIKKVAVYRQRRLKNNPEYLIGQIVIITKNNLIYKPKWTLFMVDKTQEQIESLVDVYGRDYSDYTY